MSFLSSWMAPVVYTRGSTVYVENIDKSRLWQYMHRIYGTTTFIGKFFHSKSAWSRRLSCDLFFVPELLYILEEANAETHKFSKVIAEVKKIDQNLGKKLAKKKIKYLYSGKLSFQDDATWEATALVNGEVKSFNGNHAIKDLMASIS